MWRVPLHAVSNLTRTKRSVTERTSRRRSSLRLRAAFKSLEDRRLLSIGYVTFTSADTVAFTEAWQTAESVIDVVNPPPQGQAQIPDGAQALNVQVSLNFTADRVEDLAWYVGQKASFQDGPHATGGVTGTSYSTSADIAVPTGISAEGEWYLDVEDQAPNGQDTGSIAPPEGGKTSWTITIQYYYDDQPSLSVSDANVVEGNAGTTNALFNVSLSHASGQPVDRQVWHNGWNSDCCGQ